MIEALKVLKSTKGYWIWMTGIGACSPEYAEHKMRCALAVALRMLREERA